MMETPKTKSRVIEVSLSSTITMRFREIGPGRFRMGQRGEHRKEEPVHWVEITRSYWMAETPVTQAQFELFKPGHKNGFPGNPDHPAERVTWDEAMGFCGEFLQRKIETGWIASLPTEAEWEYACRAGTKTQYYSGDEEKDLERVGWYNKNSGRTTHVVRSKAPDSENGHGLFDMHGNVWEWCFDEWDDRAYAKRLDGVADPGFEERAEYLANRARTQGRGDPLRVLRGGSWFESDVECRAAFRDRFHPGWIRIHGFRPVLVPGPGYKPG